MKRIYRGHQIDCKRERALGGWDNLYYSVFRLSDMYEVTSGFTTGSDRVVDYIKYMKENVDSFIADPREWLSDEDEEQLDYHREEILKSQGMKTPWGKPEPHKFVYGSYEVGSGGPIACKVCGEDVNNAVHASK